MNVLLIGYRGVGKTTVARHLGLLLGWDWVDADVELELRAGKSIAAIFADEGEQAFRDLEAQVIADLCQRDGLIIATGGGAVLREENRAAMRAAGKIVWLQASVKTILERLGSDKKTNSQRPSLTNKSPREEVLSLLRQREPIYAELANLTVNAKQAPKNVAKQIADWLNSQNP